MMALRQWLLPHRIVMIALFAALVLWCALTLRWDWIPKYTPLAIEGIWIDQALVGALVADVMVGDR